MGTDPENCLQEMLDADARGDGESAGKLAEAVYHAHSDSPELLGTAAHFLLWRGRLEDARAAAETACRLGPECALAWAGASSVAAFEGRFDDARAAAERALALDGSHPWVLSRAIDVIHAAGDAAAADALLDRWAALQPEDYQPLGRRITHLQASGRHEQAERLLAEMERRFPDLPRTWYLRGMFLLRAHRLEDAAATFRRAVAAMPGSAMSWSQLAMALSFLQRDEETEAAARRALEISPVMSTAMSALGRIRRRRGDTREAAAWDERAHSAVPALRWGKCLSAANAAIRRREWAKVPALVEEALSAPMRTTRHTARSIRARALIHLGRLDEAEQDLSELEQAGDRSVIWYELTGRMRRLRGGLVSAVMLLQEGIRLYPTQGTLQAELLLALHAARQSQEENALAGACAWSVPDAPWGAISLINALAATGHASEAGQLQRLAHERFPNSPELLPPANRLGQRVRRFFGFGR